MSNYSNTPWNPDTDNTIAADVVDAGPRSVTFSRLAYSDDPDLPDVVGDDAIAADTIDDGRWARRRVALALGGAASVIVASAAVALAAINSVDTSTSVTAAGGSTVMPAAAPVVRVEPPSGLPAPSTAQNTVAPVNPNVPDYVPAAAPQRPAASLVTAAPAAAPEMAPPAPAPEEVPAPPAQPLPSFPPIIINLPVPPAAPPKPPAPKPDGPVLKGPLAIPSPEKTRPVNPNLSLDAG